MALRKLICIRRKKLNSICLRSCKQLVIELKLYLQFPWISFTSICVACMDFRLLSQTHSIGLDNHSMTVLLVSRSDPNYFLYRNCLWVNRHPCGLRPGCGDRKFLFANVRFHNWAFLFLITSFLIYFFTMWHVGKYPEACSNEICWILGFNQLTKFRKFLRTLKSPTEKWFKRIV